MRRGGYSVSTSSSGSLPVFDHWMNLCKRLHSHRFRVRLLAGPQLELFHSLRQQHLHPTQRFAFRVTSDPQKARLKWIVNEIVSQPHPAKLGFADRCHLLICAGHSQGSCIHNNIELGEIGIRQLTVRDAEVTRCQSRSLDVSSKQADVGAVVGKGPQSRPRTTSSPDYRASCVLDRSKSIAQRRDETLRISVVAKQPIVLHHNRVDCANLDRKST